MGNSTAVLGMQSGMSMVRTRRQTGRSKYHVVTGTGHVGEPHAPPSEHGPVTRAECEQEERVHELKLFSNATDGSSGSGDAMADTGGRLSTPEALLGAIGIEK
jgi:hypothetical protein